MSFPSIQDLKGCSNIKITIEKLYGWGIPLILYGGNLSIKTTKNWVSLTLEDLPEGAYESHQPYLSLDRLANQLKVDSCISDFSCNIVGKKYVASLKILNPKM